MTSLICVTESDSLRDKTGVDFTHRRRSLEERQATIDCNMELYEAKYDYCDDCGEGLLSFKKGDKFLITYKADGGWWAAQNLSSNEIGYIPSTFVEVSDISVCIFLLYLCIFLKNWIFLGKSSLYLS